MQAAPRALLRAADRAREIARRTGTALVVVRNGVLMEIDPDSADIDEADSTIHDRPLITLSASPACPFPSK